MIADARRPQAAGANQLGKQSVCQDRAALEPRRAEFGDNSVSIRDQHGFSAGGKAHIFAELVFQQFDAHRPHTQQCSYL